MEEKLRKGKWAILFSLVTNKNSEVIKSKELFFLLTSIFCAIVGGVYEYFSHGVYSYFMLYAFLIPLVGGTLVMFLFDYMCKKTMPGMLIFDLYNSGIITLTIGSVLKGVLDIYGTSNMLINVYWISGALLIVVSVFLYLICSHLHKVKNKAL